MKIQILFLKLKKTEENPLDFAVLYYIWNMVVYLYNTRYKPSISISSCAIKCDNFFAFYHNYCEFRRKSACFLQQRGSQQRGERRRRQPIALQKRGPRGSAGAGRVHQRGDHARGAHSALQGLLRNTADQQGRVHGDAAEAKVSRVGAEAASGQVQGARLDGGLQRSVS